MKTLFIPAEINSAINKNKISKLNLPKEIGIAYSIQYKKIAFQIKEILSKNHKITFLIQVLGCSKHLFPKETKAILLISSGRFHAVSLALETKLPVYILEANELSKISEQEILGLQKRKNAAYLKFLSSDKAGILISSKPGQENLKTAISFKKSQKSKKCYLFISNNINPSEFENFPQITSWVNTACPRMDFDIPITNLSDLNLSHSENSLNSYNNGSRHK